MLSLNKALVKTKFEHDLCDAAFDNLNVKNRLRFNNFAYSIRVLTRHILYRLAPDVDIKCCSWYKPTKNENGKVVITRADRINYAIYGGFDNNALCENCHPRLTTVGQDAAERACAAVKAIQNLKEGSCEATMQILPVQLIIRDSVREETIYEHETGK